jgi:hypothetical protein
MRSKKLSLDDYLRANLPSELWWFNRPAGRDANAAFNAERRAWCAIHHVDGLALIRHDVAQKHDARP